MDGETKVLVLGYTSTMRRIILILLFCVVVEDIGMSIRYIEI